MPEIKIGKGELKRSPFCLAGHNIYGIAVNVLIFLANEMETKFIVAWKLFFYSGGFLN